MPPTNTTERLADYEQKYRLTEFGQTAILRAVAIGAGPAARSSTTPLEHRAAGGVHEHPARQTGGGHPGAAR